MGPAGASLAALAAAYDSPSRWCKMAEPLPAWSRRLAGAESDRSPRSGQDDATARWLPPISREVDLNSMLPKRLGFFTRLLDQVDAAERYRLATAQIIHAERSRFDSAWVASTISTKTRAAFPGRSCSWRRSPRRRRESGWGRGS